MYHESNKFIVVYLYSFVLWKLCIYSIQSMVIHWYTLREPAVVTNGFSDENVIGEGGYGIVYSGVLDDNTMVAVKNLLNKRLNYLHEGIEHIVVHRAIKSSNILLNRQWHPKVSDFGLAKLLGSETSYVTTYVAPEYGSTGMLNERSDVCLAHKPFSILLFQPLLSKIEWRDTL
ncbi:putative protein kinase RLK-Pelle-RLCK-V family [Helianthus annuus]|nr:putative protein kinase RLK-Pelle-RLCK-V family [Helianthus annuus]